MRGRRSSYLRRHRALNWERENLRQRHRRRKQRWTVLTYYSNWSRPRCVDCGVMDLVVLTLDHTDGGGERHRKAIGARGTGLVHWLLKNDLPDGYETVCANDQARRRARDPRQHGGGSPRSRKALIQGDSSKD